ncbi:hypothetical protein CQW23_09473 [Capsicum baccatum]|uniref:Protein kinase domain-containing protein n=1 Tax=Capsicum baccatum TaxID=33114 RepID=A0A2G2WWT6_CAPBA|nr:hypothetical protein CQW23_09473 [Capsicum baccatum]
MYLKKFSDEGYSSDHPSWTAAPPLTVHPPNSLNKYDSLDNKTKGAEDQKQIKIQCIFNKNTKLREHLVCDIKALFPRDSKQTWADPFGSRIYFRCKLKVHCFCSKNYYQWIRYRRGKRAPQQADSLPAITRKRISYYELLQAADDLSESNMIGSESFGSVYKGVLRSGTVNAVKVFNLQLDATFKSFDTECEVLRSLHHRNLVKVITSCSNLDFKALVLEYMPNGSLEKYLYSHNYFLDIRQRLSIMIAVTCSLEYLHHGCLSPVIHCDLKPSNVLLDEDMVAHLSDFGISKLLGEDKGDLYTKTLATLGYIVPDTSLMSTKCDVYSYGVMLLETFTRRKPNEFEGDVSLKQWVSYSLPEAVMDIVDVNLEFSTLGASSADVSMKKLLSLSAKPLDSPVGTALRKTRLVHEHYNDVLAPYLFMRHDEIPQDFGNLSFLASLDLGRNNFHGNLPREMTRLHRVKFLDLSFNSFRGEVPSWFGLLHQLQFLSLRNNSFTGSIPSSFSNLSTIETLNVNFNSIEGHIPVSQMPRGWRVFNISRIEVISFRSNSLSGKLPNGLCSGLPILKALHLSFNKLHGDIPTSLSNCSQLQLLGLSENDFDGPIHSEIGRLTNLQRLACRFWGLNVKVAVNILPSSAIEGKSPYEMLFSKPPSLSHQRVVGCLCYASVLPRGDKLSERAKPAFLMGYSTTQKGYLLMDITTNKLFVTRDVVFQEHVFPFADKTTDENTAGLTGVKPAPTPLNSNAKLTSATGVTGDIILHNATSYQKLICKLMYAIVTRHDISYVVQNLSQFMQQPKKSHLEAANRVIRRSIKGYIIHFGGSLVSWRSEKQHTVPKSLVEAECRSKSSTLADVTWLEGLFSDLNVPIIKPITILSDDKSAIQLAANPIFHERTKHIEIDFHFIMDKIKEGLVIR